MSSNTTSFYCEVTMTFMRVLGCLHSKNKVVLLSFKIPYSSAKLCYTELYSNSAMPQNLCFPEFSKHQTSQETDSLFYVALRVRNDSNIRCRKPRKAPEYSLKLCTVSGILRKTILPDDGYLRIKAYSRSLENSG